MQAASGVQRLHHVMRNALIVSAVILAALGLDLTLFPEDTDKWASATRTAAPAAEPSTAAPAPLAPQAPSAPTFQP